MTIFSSLSLTIEELDLAS